MRGDVSCPEHGRLCAYGGDEADRCPWCHCLWSHVLTTGVHSCEWGGVWSGDSPGRERAVRVVEAAVMRREAANKAADRPTSHPVGS